MSKQKHHLEWEEGFLPGCDKVVKMAQSHSILSKVNEQIPQNVTTNW